MLEELQRFDVAILDSLVELKRERDTLKQRIARLDEPGVQVHEAVRKRVRADYGGRLDAVEKKAAGLKEKARASYAELKPIEARERAAAEDQRLDEEEAELRHRLGEIDDAELSARRTKLAEGRKTRESALAAVSALVERYVSAFDSPEDLAGPPRAKAPASRAVAPPPVDEDNEHTWVTPPEPPAPPAPPPPAANPSPTPRPAPPASAPPAIAPTVIGAAPANAAPGAAPPIAPTVIGHPPVPTRPPGTIEAELATSPVSPASGARLQALDGDIDPPDFVLEPLTFIGRTPENQVRIYKPAVSRRHAQISAADGGWMLRDLSSENGTYVNGQRITERLLADGDRVQFGTSRFLFKTT